MSFSSAFRYLEGKKFDAVKEATALLHLEQADASEFNGQHVERLSRIADAAEEDMKFFEDRAIAIRKVLGQIGSSAA